MGNQHSDVLVKIIVPYERRSEAKELKCSWNPQLRSWVYIYRGIRTHDEDIQNEQLRKIFTKFDMTEQDYNELNNNLIKEVKSSIQIGNYSDNLETILNIYDYVRPERCVKKMIQIYETLQAVKKLR